ncbi:MAG: hypothetical protein M3472_04180, partial [Chloroflexota bacterium]|nr:hypothetical protein [Chloroflexota bacterium]
MTLLWLRGSRRAASLVFALWLTLVLGGCGPQAALSTSPRQAATAATSSTLAQPLPTDEPSLIPTDEPSLTPTDEPRLPGTDPTSGLPFIALRDLPDEATDTLALIDRGGPFPFDRDGITFQNREALLPYRPGDYYREYTVVTPGLSHRGVRRIVAGQGGERYYTADH